MAGSLTFGKLRSAAHRMVLELDPRRRPGREGGRAADAHVRTFREPSGNAGMIARELPCDEVLASWQHVEQRALDLRAAGIPGTLEELRVRAYLDLLKNATPASPRPPRTPPGHRPQPTLMTAATPDGPARPRPWHGRRRAARAAAVPAAVLQAARAAAAAPDGPDGMPGPAWPRWSPSPWRGPR